MPGSAQLDSCLSIILTAYRLACLLVVCRHDGREPGLLPVAPAAAEEAAPTGIKPAPLHMWEMIVVHTPGVPHLKLNGNGVRTTADDRRVRSNDAASTDTGRSFMPNLTRTSLTRPASVAFTEAACRLAMRPRLSSSLSSWPRMPSSMFMPASDRKLREQKARSAPMPPLALTEAQLLYAFTCSGVWLVSRLKACFWRLLMLSHEP